MSGYKSFAAAVKGVALTLLAVLSLLHLASHRRSSSLSAGRSRGRGTSRDVSLAAKSPGNRYQEMNGLEVDSEYPGTAVARLRAVHERVRQLTADDLSGDWENVRVNILWAGGLRDLRSAAPGQGYTGHSFNDYNHCDLTTMNDEVSHNQNQGQAEGIAIGNQLGPGIRIASIPELGPGGSWSTCMNGCSRVPPRDVAHAQFRSRIAFKLTWLPPSFDGFALVDDDGNVLARGRPSGNLPPLRERQRNYDLVRGSKYDSAVNGSC